MKYVLPSIIFFIVCLSGFSQQKSTQKTALTVVFWNVENLFDIDDDPLKNDEEFLPDSPKQWNKEKYNKKLTDIAACITSINRKAPPDFVGLAEIENKKVLQDLVRTSDLVKVNYSIVHYESPDERGIDVALLYNRNEIEIVESKPIPVDFITDTTDFTRDILYVKCRAGENILHLFVNHWPSRPPDEKDSEIKRITAAVTLRKEIDRILNLDNNARIIIMGDFNDEPTNRSILQVLGATNKLKNIGYRDLYNMMYDMHNTGDEGTLTYRDNWQMFDQIIVTPSLFAKGDGYYTAPADGRVLKNDVLLYRNAETGALQPHRTYIGDYYAGGASDHLPVYFVLRLSE